MADVTMDIASNGSLQTAERDVLVIGASFAGLYQLLCPRDRLCHHPAVPRPTPHHLRRRLDWQRPGPHARGGVAGAPWYPLPRRAARMHTACVGRAAPAARRWNRYNRSRVVGCLVSHPSDLTCAPLKTLTLRTMPAPPRRSSADRLHRQIERELRRPIQTGWASLLGREMEGKIVSIPL
jgi:hypothetical protein